MEHATAMKKEQFKQKVKDHFFSQEEFFLELEKNTGILKTQPKPALKNIQSYYGSNQYLSHKTKGKTFFSKCYFVSKQIMMLFKNRIITKCFYKPGRALDVGSGTGDFMFALKKKGWDVIGIEPAELARKKAAALGLSHVESIKKCSPLEFDLITFWHSLEHVYNFKETIKATVSALKSGGHLIVACPNYTAWDAKYYKNNWAAWDVPRHLRHFSPQSLKLVLEPEGLEQINVKPMLLDALYISILSEKIKNSRASFLKGIFFGIISNFIGLFANNFSSQIYIFKKKDN